MSEWRLRRVRDRTDREYAQPLDLEALAHGAHMSAGHFSRQFRFAYDEPPYGYLMTRRIECAVALRRRGDLSVTEVCFAVGCSSLGTFSAKQVTRPSRNREARADPRAAASVTVMDIAIHASFLPHDDPDASLAFYRDCPEVVPVVLRRGDRAVDFRTFRSSLSQTIPTDPRLQE